MQENPPETFHVSGGFSTTNKSFTLDAGYTVYNMYPTAFGKFADPATVCSHFHLREGDVAADFGAGSGHYMQSLSHGVGTSGKVYLCEIQKNLVTALGTRVQELRLRNVHPIWCDLERLEGSTLKEGSLNIGLLSNTLFQISDKSVALREIARVIRKGGKLFIIDWSESFGGLGPQPEHVVHEAEAKFFAEGAGFTYERSFPAGDHHYGMAFRRN